jgi:hypothetical protein
MGGFWGLLSLLLGVTAGLLTVAACILAAFGRLWPAVACCGAGALCATLGFIARETASQEPPVPRAAYGLIVVVNVVVLLWAATVFVGGPRP